jgi:hypothetical protein
METKLSLSEQESKVVRDLLEYALYHPLPLYKGQKDTESINTVRTILFVKMKVQEWNKKEVL